MSDTGGHVLAMNLVLDEAGMAALNPEARRKVVVILKRVRFLTLDICDQFGRTQRIRTDKLEERAALRWMLWRVGVVNVDEADPKWTRDHARHPSTAPDALKEAGE